MKTKILVAAIAIVVLAVGAIAVACAPDDKTEDTGTDATITETAGDISETIIFETDTETVE